MHARIRVVLSALFAITSLSSLSSCSDGSATSGTLGMNGSTPVHIPDAPRGIPELPRLASRPLPPLPDSSLSGSNGSLLRISTMAMAAPGARRIELKLLVVTATGDEPSYLAVRSALDRIGAPYDVLIATTTALVSTLLSNGIDDCYYRGIVIAVGGLGFFDTGTQQWTSAFSANEWTILADYERACSARELDWYGFPSADFGLTLTSGFTSDDAVAARPTSTGAEVFPYVPASAEIPIRDAFGYKATVTDPAATTALIESDDGGVLVASHVAPDGREAMLVTMDSNPSLVHSLVLEYGLVSWVSRGLFIGKKRAYLSPQVDDLFIDDDMWNTTTHRDAPDLDGEHTLRIVGSDLDAFVSWQSGLRATLPAGSQYITALGFNGIGTRRSEYPDRTLLASARSVGANLTWLSHTWDHENMDGMTATAAQSEVAQNCQLAKTLQLSGFSCVDLITPDMSGLTSADALHGIELAGVRSVVSDTSITDEVAAARGTVAGTNPSFNVGRINAQDVQIYQVPRHPTNIFYNVATRAAEADEYNTIYRSYWGRDLSYDEIIEEEASFGLNYLLTGDLDPLMFHQPNLAREMVGGTSHNLLGDWVAASIAHFTAL
ncbi:MAG TPA: hypothetical protein VHW23_39300, partial [Kofleriaceae bacterium]|nr:hypothetical protein [Kofleriaceae bacterium]